MAALDVPVHFLDPGRTRGLFVAIALARLARRLDARALHTHGYKSPIIGAIAGAMTRRPVVGTYHSEITIRPELYRYLWFETRFLRLFRGFAAVSEGVRNDLQRRGIPDSRIRVIANGIPDPLPSSEAHHAGPQPPTIAYIGRLSEEKNIGVLLDALERLRGSAVRDVRLLLAGEGPERAAIELRARAPTLAGAVELLGFRSDTPALLRRADAFVLPSRTEGVPMALLEAMAMELPIVASAVGGIPTIIRHEREALLVPAGDADALTAALERVLFDRVLATRLRAAARARYLDQFSAERMARDYERFYRDMLGGAR